MTQKLLHRTLRTYLFFSVVIMIVIAPVFYLAIEKLYIDDADEALILRKQEFSKYHQPTLFVNEIKAWNRFNRDIKIESGNDSITSDTIFFKSFLDTLANENEPYRVLNSPIKIQGKPYILLARINLVETEDLIKSIVSVFLILISLLLTGLYFITKRLSLKLWQPFYETLNQIEKFEIDKYNSVQFSESNIDEFNRLNQSIQKLIERNTIIYNSQKEFIENAAHELQTPLAVFNSKLETLIQQPELNKSQSQIISQLIDAAARLSRLNKNILLLSRIDNNQFPDSETVSLNELLEKCSPFFSEQAQTRNIKIIIESKGNITVKANATLVEILLNNLYLNATRHNVEGGDIWVSLTKHSITFRNTGKANSLPLDKLFQRFSKDSASISGTGLGLAIIKKIVDFNSWTITYKFESNYHSFSIAF